MKNRLITLLLGLFFVLAPMIPAVAQVSFGNPEKFNDGWLFTLSDDSLMSSTDYDDARWRRLDLPHDWSVEHHLSPSFR